MKENSKDIWKKMEERLSDELPQAYTEEKWADMDALLNADAAASKNKKRGFFFLIALLMFIGTGVGIRMMAPTFLLNVENNISNVQKTKTSSIDKVNVTSEKDSLFISSMGNEITPFSETTKKIKQQNNSSRISNEQASTVNDKPRDTQGLGLKKKDTKSYETIPNENKKTPLVINDEVKYGVSNDMNIGTNVGLNIVKTVPITSTTSLNILKEAAIKTKEVEIAEAKIKIGETIDLESLSMEELFLKEEEKEKRLPTIIPHKKKIGFGLMAGLNAGFASENKISFFPTGGIYAFYPINERWKLQAEVNYKKVDKYSETFAIRDTSYDNSNGSINVNTRETSFTAIKMLEASLIAKYSMNSDVSYFLGGRISRSIGHLGRNGASGTSIEAVARIPILDPFWKTSYAAILGIEIDITRRLSVDVRYNQGLLDITPDNLYRNNKNHLNSDLQFLIRYRLK